MPVSRKRKKGRGSNRPSRPQRRSPEQSGGQRELAEAFSGLAAYGGRLDEHRAGLAAAVTEPMVADLVKLAATRSDAELEDELCVRIGSMLTTFDEAPIDDHVSPHIGGAAVIGAALHGVETAEPDASPDAWRVLHAVAGIVHRPLRDRAAAQIAELGGPAGRRRSPGAALTGPVLWTRDAYGSRFGIVAPFRTGDGPQRWYLWDIDACGYEAFTVHSRYHAGPDEALADWQAGVGSPAADGTVLAPVDDLRLLYELLPRDPGLTRPGGENTEQFAEYHRSRRLAEVVLDTLDRPRTAARPALDATVAAGAFTTWLREHHPDRSTSADLDEIVAELADSWHIEGPASLYHTCSPHRVALTAAHIDNYYEADFAADVLALLPAWAAWLADRSGTPAHLADRTVPYATGKPYEAITGPDGTPEYLARVTE
ncbi:hypothetical protein [Dactylosporangium sp. CA-092794]|uniref:hypothetical protein n=1 Tax=Dactylosporangium sp. CA-092794 TaxID=3239929 RepID=UPI003D926288